MIYLILKIFVYLGFALALGGAAGWLLRQFTAQKQEDQLRRDLADSRAKVPQLESLIRARDQKIRTLSEQVSSLDSGGQGSRVQDEQLMRQLREHELEIQRLKGQLAEAHTAAADGLIAGEALLGAAQDQPSTDPGLTLGEAEGIAAASSELLATRDAQITSLQRELEQVREELAGARIQLELVATQQDYQREAQELSQRLRQRAEEQERLKTQIEQERRRVLELERERELQAKSLKVLHQQLELARENPAEPSS